MTSRIYDVVARCRKALLRFPITGALRLGACLGFISSGLAEVTILALQLFLPSEYWGGGTGAFLADKSYVAQIFIAAVFAPLFETLPGQLLPIEIAKGFGARTRYQVIISAAVFSGLHVLAGAGMAQAITTLSTGAILAIGYTVARPIGLGRSYATSAVAHAIHNAILITVF